MLKSEIAIIGQGLAGSLLAWELIERGKKVVVIDDGHQSSSSTVAAGLVNPVSGKRLRLEENIGALLGAAHTLYSDIEKRADSSFFISMPIQRLMKDADQLEYLAKRLADPAYNDYIAATESNKESALQFATGYLRTAPFLEWIRQWLMNHCSLLEEQTEYDSINIGDDCIQIGNQLETERVVFCEGYRGRDNPWFSLPLQLAKGEILTLKIDDHEFDRNRILHKGDWLVPIDDNKWRFGATHEWDFDSDKTTTAGRHELEKRLSRLLPDCKYQVLEQQAGIRPATRDRMPFIGPSKREDRLFIFNGFGSKGAMMIPYYANRFATHLVDKAPLPAEADIGRFDA